MQVIPGYCLAETAESSIGKLPAVQTDSWKKIPGGVSFISHLKEQQIKNVQPVPAAPLQTAVDSDSPMIVKVLLDRGMEYGNDKKVKDAYGQSLIHLTIDNESTKILKTLLKAGLNPSEGDAIGITPLHLYLNLILEKPRKKEFAQDAIRMLLNADADIYATGTFGISPWEMVNWRKNTLHVFPAEVITLFITHITPQEAAYAKKGDTEKQEVIQNKLNAAKAYLPFFSPRKEALKGEIEKNINHAIEKLSTAQSRK